MKLFERRYDAEEAKFSTQRTLTYYVVSMFGLVTAWVLYYGSQEQRSIIIQCWIGIMIAGWQYWIGSSKDKNQLNKLIPAPDATIQVSTPSNVTVTTEEQK